MAIATADRDKAVDRLNDKLTTLAQEVNQAAFDDTATGWKADLDAAEARLGGGGPRLAYYALAEYYALDRLASLLATRVDTEGYAVEGDRERIFDNARQLRAHAAGQAAGYGYPVDLEDYRADWVGVLLTPSVRADSVGDVPADEELPKEQAAFAFTLGKATRKRWFP